MQEITMPSGLRAVRNDGTLFQELNVSSAPVQTSFDAERWRQDLGTGSENDAPPLRPVKLISRPKAMFVEANGERVFFNAGDFLARDGEGKFSAVRAEAVRDYAILSVARDAPIEDAATAAQDVLDRTAVLRVAAKAKAEGERVSPISVREDEHGWASLVSTMPDGREKQWKVFGWKSAAEAYIADDKTRTVLEKDHEKACRNNQAMSELVHNFRISGNEGSAR